MQKRKRVSKLKRVKPKGRGQPAFAPTKQQRKRVMLWIAGGVSEASIASFFEISHPTLRTHFAVELREGHDRALMQNLARLNDAADAGNVTAMKHLDAKFAVNGAAARFARKPAPTKEEPTPKLPALGKKEQAQVDAATPDTTTTIGELMARRAQLN